MRKNWNEFFMDIAFLVSERATCERLHVGAVIVKDKQVIGTGYNGSVSGMPHCEDFGCDVVDNHCVRTLHAEMNAIIQCAKFGIATDGAEIYVTHFPCFNCCKAIVRCGIKRVYYKNGYNNDFRTSALFEQLGIDCIQI